MFYNNGDGTFTDRTEASGLKGIIGGLNTVHADYNNDGYVDVFVLRGAWLNEAGHLPNSLLKNMEIEAITIRIKVSINNL